LSIIRYNTVVEETPQGTKIAKTVNVKSVEEILKERGLYLEKNPETGANIPLNCKAKKKLLGETVCMTSKV
jgi:hypothetical protein